MSDFHLVWELSPERKLEQVTAILGASTPHQLERERVCVGNISTSTATASDKVTTYQLHTLYVTRINPMCTVCKHHQLTHPQFVIILKTASQHCGEGRNV